MAGQREQQLLDLIIVGKYFCASRQPASDFSSGSDPASSNGSVSITDSRGGGGGGGVVAQVDSSEASLYSDRLLLPHVAC